MPAPYRRTWLGGLLSALLLAGGLAGCDLPTGPPSINTNTTVNAPLIAENTFVFLGGPKSTNAPLIDTTRAGIGSLFGVSGSGRTVILEQEVQSFGSGTLNGTLEKAAHGMQIDTSFSGPIVQDNPIARQDINLSYERTPGTFESPGHVDSTPVPAPSRETELEIPFPVSTIFDPPTTEVVNAEGATVKSVTLTGRGNDITFTLTNNKQTNTPLTSGTSGDAPEIAIRNENGPDPLPFTAFGKTPLPPGKTRSITVDVSDKRLGTESTIVLHIDGSGRDDELTIDTHPHLRYDTVTLSNPSTVRVRASATGLNTPARTASRFAGLHVAGGPLNVRVENDFAFPLAIDRLRIENTPDALDLLPSDFPALDLSMGERSSFSVQAGASATRSFKMAGSGMARRVDVILEGRPASSSGTVTLHAGDGLRTVAQGDPAISTMHFWPEGEEVRTTGTLPFSPERVSFEQDGDFVEMAASTVRLQKLTNNLGVGFDSFTLSYPGIRLPDANDDGQQYAPGDSLFISLVDDPSGRFEFAPLRRSDTRNVEVSIPSLRFFPTNNALRFRLHGTLGTAPDTTKEHLRVLRVNEELSASLSIDQFEVEALQGTVAPFTMDVTPDANDNGRLDVADTAEAQAVSLQRLQGFAQQIDDLQLQGSALTLSVETDLGANTRLYGALMGRSADESHFLKGKGPQQVAASDSIGNDFERAGTPLGAENLVQFDVESGTDGQPVTRSVTLTDENSNVNNFISQLPTHLRFAGKNQVKGGHLHVRKPVRFNVGVGFSVPLAFTDRVSYRDTLDADLSGLAALTDPTQRVTISSAQLQVEYANSIPLDFDATVHVVGEKGRSLVSLPSDGESLTLKAARKTTNESSPSPRNETLNLTLSSDEVHSLARGHKLQLQLTMSPQNEGAAVRIRADDTIRLSFSTDIEASVQTGI